MTERAIRSTHALPSTPRRRLGRVAISVALTAIASIVLGIQGTPGAHASDERRSDRSLKAKALTAFPQESSQRTHGTQFREGKYTVIVGDTVSQIAASAGVSTAELLGANGLSWKTLIFAGQLLDIPHSTSGTSVPTMSPAITRHRVVAGDTLELIGRSYGIQPRALMTANGLDRSSRLIVGQRLVVPDAVVMGELPAESLA